ncbi:hypothetical protein AURDEDRAFT_164470 [Auricularia subglabra TFB-10046 SS5]|nr:hypothetical protein AURDEDRAFT_164470 [Auricularia subglabra TFB-10046 SS5]
MAALFQNEEINDLITELINECNKDLSLAVKAGQRTLLSLKNTISQLESFKERVDEEMLRGTARS